MASKFEERPLGQDKSGDYRTFVNWKKLLTCWLLLQSGLPSDYEIAQLRDSLETDSKGLIKKEALLNVS